MQVRLGQCESDANNRTVQHRDQHSADDDSWRVLHEAKTGNQSSSQSFDGAENGTSARISVPRMGSDLIIPGSEVESRKGDSLASVSGELTPDPSRFVRADFDSLRRSL